MNNIVIYPERESKILEFKSALSSQFQSIIKTCIAFANGHGGKIIIGVEDKTKKIIGITEKDRDRIYEDFPNSLYDSVSPNLFPQIYEKNFGNASVLIIEISPCLKKPYFLKNEGIPKGVYSRIGSSTRRANQEYIEDLVREGKRISFDEENIKQNTNILSPELLKNFYHTTVTKKRLLTDKLITKLPANNEEYTPTVAGTILFCEHPENFIPEAIIKCTRFSGIQGRDIIQTEEITGNLEKQSEISINLIESWLKKNYQLTGTKLKSQLPIPHVALREAIINALIHRKYSIPGAIKIAVYDNHLEIFNPGCFPGLVDINNLGDGTTYLRNPIIARIAHKIGLVEKLGSGIRLLLDSCRKMGLRKPVFNEDGDFVKITFYFEFEQNFEQTDEEAILSLISLFGEITIEKIVHCIHLSRNTATRRVNKLIQKGKIIRLGKGPATKFRFSSSYK